MAKLGVNDSRDAMWIQLDAAGSSSTAAVDRLLQLLTLHSMHGAADATAANRTSRRAVMCAPRVIVNRQRALCGGGQESGEHHLVGSARQPILHRYTTSCIYTSHQDMIYKCLLKVREARTWKEDQSQWPMMLQRDMGSGGRLNEELGGVLRSLLTR